MRFSVKEAVVKKVIFEGLDGEAIAGKVKIGFEDGIPVVQEVTDGRIFITLTAPGGASFEVGKWYYIVAIPGALDKGFKLRFYKEDTYARLTSENAVQVKRSIFGSIAGADEGVEYQSVVTHFPETEEEIRNSYELGRSIDLQYSNTGFCGSRDSFFTNNTCTTQNLLLYLHYEICRYKW